MTATRAAQIMRLLRDRRGASAVEMALVAPLLGVMLVGGVDIGLGFTARLDLEQAAGRTIDLAVVPGKVKPNYDYLRREAAVASGRPESSVTVDNWLECNGKRSANFMSTCTSGQQIARYVSVSITAPYTPTFSWMERFIASRSNGQEATLIGDATVRIQ